MASPLITIITCIFICMCACTCLYNLTTFSFVCMVYVTRIDHLGLDNLCERSSVEETDSPYHSSHWPLVACDLGVAPYENMCPYLWWHANWWCHYACWFCSGKHTVESLWIHFPLSCIYVYGYYITDILVLWF